jgi:hypothetical protein
MKDHTDVRLTLKPWEVKKLVTAPVQGGQLTLKEKLVSKLEPGESGCEAITLEDALLGEVVRHMGYGTVGGWQSRLREAFLPAINRYVGAV